MRRLELNLNTLDSIHQRWLSFLENVPDVNRQEEEQGYKEMTNDESGILNVMEDGK